MWTGTFQNVCPVQMPLNCPQGVQSQSLLHDSACGPWSPTEGPFLGNLMESPCLPVAGPVMWIDSGKAAVAPTRSRNRLSCLGSISLCSPVLDPHGGLAVPGTPLPPYRPVPSGPSGFRGPLVLVTRVSGCARYKNKSNS